MPDLPQRLRDVTPEWLSEVLRASGSLGSARVAAVEPEFIGRFSNEVWRLRVRYEPNSGAAPATLIAKCPRPEAEIDRLDEFESEIRFYRELGALCPVRTPRFYYGDRDRASGCARWSRLSRFPSSRFACTGTSVRRVIAVTRGCVKNFSRSFDKL